MSKHTPGPWTARQVFANRWNIEVQREGLVPLTLGHVATTVLEVGTGDAAVTGANARLIAAAPEMYEALDWYAEIARQMQRATLYMDSQTMLHLMKELALDGGRRANQARAAVAKSEGRA